MSYSPQFADDAARSGVKVIIIGTVGSGKSCLVIRYADNRFDMYMRPSTTIGAAYTQRIVRTSRKAMVTLNIWDTGGSERFKSIAKSYFRGAQAAILCFEVGNQASFDTTRMWYEELLQTEEKARIYLCGTKLDLVQDGIAGRNIKEDVLQSFIETTQAQYYETSSKTGEGISELFSAIAEDFASTCGLRDAETPKTTKPSAGGKKVNCSCG